MKNGGAGEGVAVVPGVVRRGGMGIALRRPDWGTRVGPVDVTEAPEPDCWLHRDVQVAPSPIEGQGLVARARITAGVRVARLGGRLVTDEKLVGLFADASRTGTYVDTVSVYDCVNLVLPPGDPLHAGNHSCDPTMWWTDPYTLVARRDVDAGEELTLDYATITDDAAFAMECRCGTPLCRGRVTGLDWRLGTLQHAYGVHWVPVLRQRLRAAQR